MQHQRVLSDGQAALGATLTFSPTVPDGHAAGCNPIFSRRPGSVVTRSGQAAGGAPRQLTQRLSTARG
jgi:hypothetical protein